MRMPGILACSAAITAHVSSVLPSSTTTTSVAPTCQRSDHFGDDSPNGAAFVMGRHDHRHNRNCRHSSPCLWIFLGRYNSTPAIVSNRSYVERTYSMILREASVLYLSSSR